MTGAKVLAVQGGTLVSPVMKVPWDESRMVARFVGENWKRNTHGEPIEDQRLRPAGRGIHAYRNLRAAVAAQYSSDRNQQQAHPGSWAAYAIVRPEGETIVGEYGWVAEAAEIVRIFLPPKLYLSTARALYDRYRVPVEVLPRSLCEERGVSRYLARLDCPFQAQPKPTPLPVARAWLRLHYHPDTCPRLLYPLQYIRRVPNRPADIVRYDPAIPALRVGPWARDYGLGYRVTHGKYAHRYAEFRTTMLPSRKRQNRAALLEHYRKRQQRRSPAEKESLAWLISVSRIMGR